MIFQKCRHIFLLKKFRKPNKANQGRRWVEIEGYYIKGLGPSTGTLHIEVKNLPEFEKLISQAKKEADQLQATINRLKCFELEITFNVGSREITLEK